MVSDFDGTMTERDFFDCVLEHLDTEHVPDYWGEYLAGRRSHFEALRGIFSHLRGGEEAIMTVARQTGLDPELPESIRRLRAAGWEVVVVSAGCAWYIERLLGERGVLLPVVSNPGEVAADGGLHMRLPSESPFFSAETGIDKGAVVRWALEQFDEVAFAGDGRPDEAPARQIPADRRFARGWLAARFRADETPFRPFARWSDVAAALAVDGG